MGMGIGYLKGKILDKVEIISDNVKDDAIVFHIKGGEKLYMKHLQDCCESVYIEDICGHLSDLVGAPILTAEERTNSDKTPEGAPDMCAESWTWTFYELATVRGSVTIRWFGESNGYYSEDVDCYFYNKED